MRFEISYRGGTTHEVELAGHVFVVGRDPGCDIVLNDTKCSRRHAVVEDGPEGIVIRDSGSANGIYVNGKRVESSALRPGDTVRLGEVTLRLLAELGETVIVASEDIELGTGEGALQYPPAPAPDPVPPPPAAPTPPVPRPSAGVAAPPRPALPRPTPSRGPREPRTPSTAKGGRPATVSLLAGLWAVFVPAAVAVVLLAAARLHAGWLGWLAAAVLALVLAGLGITMALGLRALAPWARYLQIAAAAVGLLACPFTLAAATVLLYMTRPEVKATFEGSPRGQGDSAEPTFALSLAGMLVLGLALTAMAVLLL